MLGMAVVQVFAREVGLGLYWGDDLVRMSVLWVTMVGAIVAIDDNKHIRIDLVDKVLSPATLRWVQSCAFLVTAFICGAFGYYSIDMVSWDYALGSPGVGLIPAWIFQTIIPIAAFVMAIRFTLRAFIPAEP